MIPPEEDSIYQTFIFIAFCGDGEWNTRCCHLVKVGGRKKRNCSSRSTPQNQYNGPNCLKTPWEKQIPDMSSWEFSSMSPCSLSSFSSLVLLFLEHYSGLWAGWQGAWGWVRHTPPHLSNALSGEVACSSPPSLVPDYSPSEVPFLQSRSYLLWTTSFTEDSDWIHYFSQ